MAQAVLLFAVLACGAQVARCQMEIDGWSAQTDPSLSWGSQTQQVQSPYGSPYGTPASPYGKNDWSGTLGGFPTAYTELHANIGPEYYQSNGAVESHQAWQGRTPKLVEGNRYLDNPLMKSRMVAHPDQGQLHTVVDNDAAVMPPTHRPHPTERLFHYESNSPADLDFVWPEQDSPIKRCVK